MPGNGSRPAFAGFIRGHLDFASEPSAGHRCRKPRPPR
jgi:hypothetical protein